MIYDHPLKKQTAASLTGFILFAFFQIKGKSFWPSLRAARYFVRLGYEMQNPVQPSFKEFFVQVLGSPGKEQVYLDAIAFPEPFRSFFSLEFQVVLTGPYLYLD